MTRKEERIRQVRRQKMILMGIGIGILFFAILVGSIVAGNKKKEREAREAAQKQEQEKKEKEAAEKKKEEKILGKIKVNFGKLSSKNAVLVDVKSGKVLEEKNSDDKIHPASMTKIMTVLVAVEQMKDLEKEITIPQEILGDLIENNASVAGFHMDEKVKAEDLLYGAILASGSDCCLTIAREVSSSEEEYVKLMNKKAEKLGLKNTHFANVTGFYNEKNYSTVEDIAKLLKAALKNKEFRKVFTTDTYTTTATKEHPEGIELKSALYKNLETLEVTGGKILGGKPGYEDGLCLASLASINGREFILVTANSDGNMDTEGFHVEDAVNVYKQIGESK